MRKNGELRCDRCGVTMLYVSKILNTKRYRGHQEEKATAEVCHRCWPDVVGDMALKDIPYEVAKSSLSLTVDHYHFGKAFPEIELRPYPRHRK